MGRLGDLRRRIRGVRRISPAGFLLYALAIVIVYAIMHALGLRQFASMVCGNPVSLFGSVLLGVVAGSLYIFFHFAAVVGVPILVIASCIFALSERALRRRKG